MAIGISGLNKRCDFMRGRYSGRPLVDLAALQARRHKMTALTRRHICTIAAGIRHWRCLGAVVSVLAAFLCTAPQPAASQTVKAAAAQSESDANSNRSQEIEKLALQIMNTPTVQQAIARGLKSYAASDAASKPDAMRYAKSAVDETAMLASLNAAMGVAPEPTFIWVYATPRRWHGYTLPGSRWYADNADAIYRSARVDDTSSYEITAYPGKVLPSQLSFMLYDWLEFETGTKERSDVPVDTIEITDATPRNPDGSITMTVGPDPANGRANHLQLKPGVKQVFVREIRGDGSLPPVRLAIQRTKGAAPKGKTLDELSKEAATYIDSGIDGTGKITVVFGSLAENEPSPVRVRYIKETGSPDQKLVTDEPLGPDVALGFITNFLLNLKEDEALVLTLNMMGAKYVSVNSYRPFLVSPEHVYRTSSLNNFQSKPNPDGSITFVFARKDPGVFNWIDSGGIPYGEVAVRWQTLTGPVSGTLKNAVQSVKLVDLADLRKELPATMTWVTPEERAEQRATRAKQFMLRCLGTPCEVGGDLDRPY